MSRPSLTKENARLRFGQADWAPFDIGMEPLLSAANRWAKQLEGVEKPWLCWNISPAWCLLQQKLVKHVGWTPVVGFDPKYEQPSLVKGAIQINFNEDLNLPHMYFHFPLDFVWAYAPRFAFWHSDLLLRLPYLEEVALIFEKLEDGEMAAVWDYGGLRQLLNPRMHRYYELLGCMTRGASKSNFDTGCGWWRNIHCHPNVATEAGRKDRERIFYDHGFGIMYWKRHHGGRVRNLSLRRTAEGHCSEIGNKNYKNLPNHYDATRNTGKEMELNYDLEQVCKRLGLEQFL